MNIRKLGLAAFFACVFLTLATGAVAEDRTSPSSRLEKQTEQLNEALRRGNESASRLTSQVSGMLDSLRADDPRLDAAHLRIDTVRYTSDALQIASVAADKLLYSLQVYTLIRYQPDRKRIAPLLVAMRDSAVREMELGFSAVERLLPRLAGLTAGDTARDALREYRAAQDIMRNMKF